MAKYIVKSPAVTVLKKTNLVVAEYTKRLKPDESLSQILPDAWMQGEWTNIVVEKNTVLDDVNYEKGRLMQLAQGDHTTASIELLEDESTDPKKTNKE